MSTIPKKMGQKLFYLSLLLVFVLLLYTASFFFLPHISTLKNQNPHETAFMHYRLQQWKKTGKKRAIVHHWVALNNIAPIAVRAVIIAEDAKFWHHEGFDFEAIQHAIEKDIATRQFKFGASTITQQLVKNLYLNPSKNPLRKMKEAILTWRMERTLSKARIIELYLNVVEWGDGLFGIGAAAEHYYHVSASELSTHQAACLAVTLPNPIRYHPTSGERFVVHRSSKIIAYLLGSSRSKANPSALSHDTTSQPDTAAPTPPIDSVRPKPIESADSLLGELSAILDKVQASALHLDSVKTTPTEE